MAKFMNAELISIKESLNCGHCKSVFSGSDSQAWKVKYESATVYCSVTCRSTGIANRLRKPLKEFGPCKNCGGMFESKNPKIYCTISCYTNSKQFKDMQLENIKKMPAPAKKEIEQTTCAECGTLFKKRNATKSKPARKYCSHICYRVHKAKAFDRWVANPQKMALPQCYDEFLTQESIHCLVDGCTWSGKQLSTHMISAHGVPAEEFKRAAGFNLNTGVISLPLSKAFSKRELQGVALSPPAQPAHAIESAKNRKPSVKYKSLEGKENRAKGIALSLLNEGPVKVCLGCNQKFRQSTPYGRTLYCSKLCRNSHYAKQKKANAKIRLRNIDGTFSWVSPLVIP